jgi:hypothetical protein
MCFKVEHIAFPDSLNYLPFPLRTLTDAFWLPFSQSWYPPYFNTYENLNYIGAMPDIVLRCWRYVAFGARRVPWLVRGEKGTTFNNRLVFEAYCQDEVTVLRQACQILRRNFIEIGNIQVFVEAITIALACKKVLRKRFLKPDTIGLIPAGRYTNNSPQNKKALMWLAYREPTDACSMLHGRNGREYGLSELPHMKVDGYCEQTRTVY